MKEGAPAGKDWTIARAFLPQRKGGTEGRQGILGGSPALSHERTTALCSREIPPPVRAGIASRTRRGGVALGPDNPSAIMRENKK